ncbi:MAG: PIN domain-containing protein [Fimbriimonadaceae bacterium]|nr:PIN domain-containing protein [Fimbriimonadaceae bacterium]
MSDLGRRVYVDTMVAIYAVERMVPYERQLAPLWEAVAAGAVQAVTSELTMMETMVKPYREGDAELVALYAEFLEQLTALQPVDRRILDRAARLRATVRALRTPDAIHAATAIETGHLSVLTNDARFSQIPGLTVHLVADLPG